MNEKYKNKTQCRIYHNRKDEKSKQEQSRGIKEFWLDKEDNMDCLKFW